MSNIPIFKEAGIPNSAVITDTTETASGTADSVLDNLLTGSYSKHPVDYNNDGKISVKELHELWKGKYEKLQKLEQNGTERKPEDRIIPQIWDPQDITGRLVLVDK